MRILVGRAAIDGLKEGRGLENVNGLRYLRFNELPLAGGRGCLVFSVLLIRWRSELLVLILIRQGIPPWFSQTRQKFTGATTFVLFRETDLRKSLNIYIESEITRLLETE